MRKFTLALLAILLLLLPFHPFLATWLNSLFFDPTTAPAMVIAIWKEVIVAIIALIFIIQFLRGKIKPQFDMLDFFIILFFLWSFITGFLWTDGGFIQIIYGAKYSLSFLLLFFVLRSMIFTAKEKNTFFYLALGSATLVIIFGVIAKFLPEDFLVHFGYSSPAGPKSVANALAYCQKTPLTDQIDICRAQSTLSGPNQLGAYLTFILPLIFFAGLKTKNLLFKIVHFFILILGLYVLYLTYSRGAWLGTFGVAILAFAMAFRKQKWFSIFANIIAFLSVFLIGLAVVLTKSEVLIEGVGKFHGFIFNLLHAKSFYLGIFVITAILAVVGAWKKFPLISYFVGLFNAGVYFIFLLSHFFGEWFWQVLLRPSSTQGHWERTADGIYYLQQNPFGLGLGDAGPASNHFATDYLGFIPENWFLQVGLESGFIGLVLFILILVFALYKLFKSENDFAITLGIGLLGLIFNSLFLHTWESAAVALTFWGLAGLALAREEKDGFWQKIKNFFSNLKSKFFEL